MKTLLKECKKGNHDLQAILRLDAGYNADYVVRWCEQCGSVVVDGGFDGRTNAGQFVKMKYPILFRETFKEQI